ncbi:phosphoglycerate mutase-like protein, partial [Corynespora cassiicola Philippines]
MSSQNTQPPRIWIVRHGDTEWAKEGRFTGHTEIELNEEGITQLSWTRKDWVGTNKLLDPTRLAKVYVSPRKRTRQTCEILLQGFSSTKEITEYTEDITEWDYGDYEGLTEPEIRKKCPKEWNIWSDGCPGGESPQQVTDRLDKFIKRIKEHQKERMNKDEDSDILL